MEDVLKENMYAGDLVRKSLVPSKYRDVFGVNNLYRYSHPEGFRSCYTIFSEESIGAFVRFKNGLRRGYPIHAYKTLREIRLPDISNILAFEALYD